MSEVRVTSPRVTVLPATRNRFTTTPIASVQKRRVAAYARVSTDSDEQLTSYEAQVDYYTHYIKERPDWTFAGMYADEGISGTNTKRREGFNQMIADALAGKIDLIVTKSVSRFARNTVDSLTTVRRLKEKGVEVYFQKENIYTLDSKGELLITIMSSLAQEESRSISENVTWGQRKRFADGKVSMPYKNFLGYRKGENGEPEIVPEEAEVVRRIYRLFLEGQTPYGIKQILEAEHTPTPAGKQTWQTATILSILTNEKYKGDALLQKTFCTDFLTKKMKINEGEVPQYYVENSHPAIIEPEVFDMAQDELARRKQTGRSHHGTSCFAGKLVCGCCGGLYGSKVWHSTDKYRRVIWQCNGKFKGKEKCDTPHLTEEAIQQKFLAAFNALLENRDFILEDTKELMTRLTDTSRLEEEAVRLRNEMAGISQSVRALTDRNARSGVDQGAYDREYQGMTERFAELEKRLKNIEAECYRRKIQRSAMGNFLKALKTTQAPIADFTSQLWNAMVEKATVNADGSMVFTFRNGLTIRQKA